MKSPEKALIVLIAAIVVGFFYFKNKSTRQSAPAVPMETDFLGEPLELPNKPIKIRLESTPAPKSIQSSDLKKCGHFLTSSSADNLEATVLEIKKTLMAEETLELTEYQLRGGDNAEIIVQQTPNEEPKNQIRVFKLAADGFPDRIKKFPNSSDDSQSQLAGALTLGTQKNKIEKYQIIKPQAELRYDKTENKIVRISFLQGKFQLICEEQTCSCQEIKN